MNKQEAQRKYEIDSQIDNSLYDTVNTHTIRRADSSLNGNNLPPKTRQSSSSLFDLFLSCLGVGTAIFCYIIIVPLFERLLPSAIYDSLTFLAFALFFSCGFGWFIKMAILLLIKKIRET